MARKIKIAFIYDDRKVATGAGYINNLIAKKLRENGVIVKQFYPRQNLIDHINSINLKGLANILFFYSLLEHKEEILKCDLIQGTTYTPLTFIPFRIPVISHFGSTTKGFLDNTPKANNIEEETRSVFYELKKQKIIKELNLKTRRPLRDIAEIELYVASKSDKVIATSEKVKQELISGGIKKEKIVKIYNAIEDYWFNISLNESTKENTNIIFLGRFGNDVFNLKLKGVDRVIDIFKEFKDVNKKTIAITTNEKFIEYFSKIENHQFFSNVQKDEIPKLLNNFFGSIVFISSRYEGFSLSLIEAMSQGLIPVCYDVGVVPEIIKNGYNGFIVKNQKEAKERIRFILGNKKERIKMAKNANKTALQFSADKMALEMIKVYKDVLNI